MTKVFDISAPISSKVHGFLYHYAGTKYPELLTRLAQQQRGLISADPSVCSTSISFFFDPVDTHLVSGKFPSTHPVWVKGKHIYEHIVTISDIDLDYFDVVETPALTRLADAYWGKVPKKKYDEMENIVKNRDKTTGSSLDEFDRVYKRFSGTTNRYFRKLIQRPDFKQLTGYYAACVPHVKITPKSGAIPVSRHCSIIV